jgi:hypothetical protein
MQKNIVEFIDNHETLFGNEGNITPKTHDLGHFPLQRLLFGPSKNTNEYCFESMFNDVLKTTKDSNRNQMNAISNYYSCIDRIHNLDNDRIHKGNHSELFSKKLLDLTNKHFNKNKSCGRYEGEIQTTFSFNHQIVQVKSLKWIYLERNKKILSISPDSYLKDTSDSYIKIKIENKEYFANVKCIVTTEEIYVCLATTNKIKNNMSVKTVTGDLFYFMKFEENTTKIKASQIINKAVCFSLRENKRFFYCSNIDEK